MFATITIGFFGAVAIVVTNRTQRSLMPLSKTLSRRLQKLWGDAQEGIKQHKYLRAERALLTILKFDERNSAAYNRLGILYARQHEYADAIECFEIASSIDQSPSSLHNLGLIYYETHNYEKAALAFENALEQESNLASRHIAYAKVMERLGNSQKVIESLEKAVEIEPNPQTYKLLAEAYETNGEPELAEQIKAKLSRLIIRNDKRRRVSQPRKLVM